jgi:PadR family transcriptional regulator, regulatory protein PadR
MPAAAHRQSRHLPAFILLALTDGPLHGHAIRSVLLDRFHGYKADPGAMYRTLQMLEEAGEVAFHWDTNSRGPARKVYTLTPTGWERLEFWKVDIENRLAFLQTFLDLFDRSRSNKKATP